MMNPHLFIFSLVLLVAALLPLHGMANTKAEPFYNSQASYAYEPSSALPIMQVRDNTGGLGNNSPPTPGRSDETTGDEIHMRFSSTPDEARANKKNGESVVRAPFNLSGTITREARRLTLKELRRGALAFGYEYLGEWPTKGIIGLGAMGYFYSQDQIEGTASLGRGNKLVFKLDDFRDVDIEDIGGRLELRHQVRRGLLAGSELRLRGNTSGEPDEKRDYGIYAQIRIPF